MSTTTITSDGYESTLDIEDKTATATVDPDGNITATKFDGSTITGTTTDITTTPKIKRRNKMANSQ
jgi:hypothetical protein